MALSHPEYLNPLLNPEYFHLEANHQVERGFRRKLKDWSKRELEIYFPAMLILFPIVSHYQMYSMQEINEIVDTVKIQLPWFGSWHRNCPRRCFQKWHKIVHSELSLWRGRHTLKRQNLFLNFICFSSIKLYKGGNKRSRWTKQGVSQCSFLVLETTLTPTGKMKSAEINWEALPKELVQWEWGNEGIRDEQPPSGHLKILINTRKTGKCF